MEKEWDNSYPLFLVLYNDHVYSIAFPTAAGRTSVNVVVVRRVVDFDGTLYLLVGALHSTRKALSEEGKQNLPGPYDQKRSPKR